MTNNPGFYTDVVGSEWLIGGLGLVEAGLEDLSRRWDLVDGE